ncbi:MAG: hypothetical protein AB1486_15375, partial [Planctomycetota bacterium]
DAAQGYRLWEQLGDRLAEIMADPMERAASSLGRTRLDEPLDVGSRLRLLSVQAHRADGGTPSGYVALVADAILEHEKTHLLDARRFLPLADNLPAKVWLLLRLGFSISRVEAWLEERAQLRALVTARDPRIPLAVACGFLPVSTGEAVAHAVGYASMVRVLVEELNRSASEYAAIDASRNLLQQLARLSVEELRQLGRRVMD